VATFQRTPGIAALGGEHFWVLSTAWLGIGILGIGLLNILVSLSLALLVAIRARNLRGPEQHQFYRAIMSRFLKSPLSFLLPIGVTASPKAVTPVQ
jgi:site-specific recombinase